MFRYYVFDKNIYEYKDCGKEGVEIRRKDGKDINYNGDIEVEEFDEELYNYFLKMEEKGEKLAEHYKNRCNPKVYFIDSYYHQIIDSDEIINYSGNDIFIVIDND